jgi:ribulose-5-phosphate 4-epimerase/fuculose-1-phosphate aldolase
MKVSDLVHIDEDGNMMDPESAAGKSVNAAGFLIHAAIHRARPDINAACHTHSPYGKAFSTFGEPIEMLNQDACMFYERLAVYANFGGAVVTEEEGENIAKALGSDKTCAILQNHGLLTTGSTVKEAAYLHTCLENCCKVQLAVHAAMANPNHKKYYISHEEAVMTRNLIARKDYLYNHFQPDYRLLLEETNGAFLK